MGLNTGQVAHPKIRWKVQVDIRYCLVVEWSHSAMATNWTRDCCSLAVQGQLSEALLAVDMITRKLLRLFEGI